MTHRILLRVLFALATSLGCTPLLPTPSGFVELDDATWSYRATSADGVVLAVRHLDHDPVGELSFWAQAVERELDRRGGYAKVAQTRVATEDGVPGELLQFRHDVGEIPHLYYVGVFVDDDVLGPDDLFIVEAGGAEDSVTASKEAVLRAITRLRVD